MEGGGIGAPTSQPFRLLPSRPHIGVPLQSLPVIAEGRGRVTHHPVEVGEPPGAVQGVGVDFAEAVKHLQGSLMLSPGYEVIR